MLAEGAGDVIATGVYALANQMTVREMASLWCPYLTMAEGLLLTAQALHPRRVHAVLLRRLNPADQHQSRADEEESAVSTDLDHLSTQLASSLRGSRDELPWLWPTPLRALAHGEPVIPDDLATATGRDLAEVRAGLGAPSDAAPWLSAHSDSSVLTVGEAFDLGAQLAASLLTGDAPACC